MAISEYVYVVLILFVEGLITLLIINGIFWLPNYYRSLRNALLELLPNFTYTAASSSTAAVCAICLKEIKEGDVCAICLKEFKEGDVGRLLPNCNHFFHHCCIKEWIQRHKTRCPLCKEIITPRTTSLLNIQKHLVEENVSRRIR
ncbi:hypothetical protein K1719_026177 [Acacia pycnantha]|nr:hypothetical protein K1719_026177 [Acacia pycnantha]